MSGISCDKNIADPHPICNNAIYFPFAYIYYSNIPQNIPKLIFSLKNHLDQISPGVNGCKVKDGLEVGNLQDKDSFFNAVVDQDCDNLFIVDEMQHCMILIFLQMLGQFL